MTGRLTVRDVPEQDLAVLREAARRHDVSLNRYVLSVLHEQAQQERHRSLFAAVAAQEPDLPPTDAVAEVRAMRDDKDAHDEQENSR